MFYRPAEGHGLDRNPFNQLVVPRPIGWISTLGADGRANLAPYSFFNAVSYVPPHVMYGTTGPHTTGGRKDSLRQIAETGEFVVNLATWPLRDAVNTSSAPAPPGTDEFELAGLTKEASVVVAAPRVAESPAHLECRLVTVLELPTADRERHANTVVFGEVVGVHIADEAIVDGRVEVARLDPIARLGYDQYTRVGEIFRMTRPTWPV